jgi:molecular chaperone DnaK
MEGEDVDAIKKATDDLSQASHKLAEQLYQQQSQGQAGGGAAGGAGGAEQAGGGGAQSSQDEDVVDAEYTEQK